MNDRYDVVVVGGGPAGSWMAKHAAENGVSVLLLEKDREIGLPVRCAEGVGAKDLARVVDVQSSWISQKVTGVRFFAPDGTVVEAEPGETGYVLDRKRFDADLAALAARAGAEVRTKAYVSGLLVEDGSVQGVRLFHLGHEFRIRASVVVGADGVESRVGRWAGLRTQVSPEDMTSCIQFTLAHPDIVADVAELHFGRKIAPSGYLWVFPKGGRKANVGLGITGAYSLNKKPIFYLREYVERRYPGASILTLVAGGVPVGPPLKDIVSNGLMLVGDAARQANPLTGGGIVNAMVAGAIAGKVAAESIRSGDVSRKRLSHYAKEWHKIEGKNNELFYKIRTTVDRFDDGDLNRIAQI
ncbi:MAG TPA: NAD(P)/FAD-dependent oxidoreductase, partial [bacterium]